MSEEEINYQNCIIFIRNNFCADRSSFHQYFKISLYKIIYAFVTIKCQAQSQHPNLLKSDHKVTSK